MQFSDVPGSPGSQFSYPISPGPGMKIVVPSQRNTLVSVMSRTPSVQKLLAPKSVRSKKINVNVTHFILLFYQFIILHKYVFDLIDFSYPPTK